MAITVRIPILIRTITQEGNLAATARHGPATRITGITDAAQRRDAVEAGSAASPKPWSTAGVAQVVHVAFATATITDSARATGDGYANATVTTGNVGKARDIGIAARGH